MAQQEPETYTPDTWPPVDTVFTDDWAIGAAITDQGAFIALVTLRGHRPDGDGGMLPQEEIKAAMRPSQLLQLAKDLIETFETGSIAAAHHAREHRGEGD